MSEEKAIVFGTPTAPDDKTISKQIVKKEKPKRKYKKKICEFTQKSPIYVWTCELKPNHEGEHKLKPNPRIVPGLEIKKKESTTLG